MRAIHQAPSKPGARRLLDVQPTLLSGVGDKSRGVHCRVVSELPAPEVGFSACCPALQLGTKDGKCLLTPLLPLHLRCIFSKLDRKTKTVVSCSTQSNAACTCASDCWAIRLVAGCRWYGTDIRWC